jgi:hypothetical protein
VAYDVGSAGEVNHQARCDHDAATSLGGSSRDAGSDFDVGGHGGGGVASEETVRLAWRHEGGAPVFSAPAVVPGLGTVVFAAVDGQLGALSPTGLSARLPVCLSVGRLGTCC